VASLKAIPSIATHVTLAWSVRLYVCRLTHSCTLAKAIWQGQSINQSTMYLYSAEALKVSKALERRQSVVSKQESFWITIENVNGE